MLRFSLLVLLRFILAVLLLTALWRLVRRTWSSFWEGLRGPRPESPRPQGGPARPTITYRDVRDASFTEERHAS